MKHVAPILRQRAELALDALLGREGERLDAAALERFYAEAYLANNPELDVEDVAQKGDFLIEVCRRAGIAAAPSVLEVGCGSGALLERMAGALHADRAVGADYSASIAEVARKRGGFEVVVADGASLPFRDAEFDLVYFADVLEHVLSPSTWLRQVARVGRRVAFLVPLESGLVANAMYAARRVRGKRTNYEQYGHIWRWRRAQVMDLVADAGLSLDAWFVQTQAARYDWQNWKGKVVEGLRDASLRVSPRASEALFGNTAFLGVASPVAR